MEFQDLPALPAGRLLAYSMHPSHEIILTFKKGQMGREEGRQQRAATAAVFREGNYFIKSKEHMLF